MDNNCVDCLSCHQLKDCCNGSFEGPYRKLVREEEADIYGRGYLVSLPQRKGWYYHEHFGRCPHSDTRTGLCGIHDKGKPAWCQLFPVGFNDQGEVALEAACVSCIIPTNLEGHIAQVRAHVTRFEPVRIQLLEKTRLMLKDANCRAGFDGKPLLQKQSQALRER